MGISLMDDGLIDVRALAQRAPIVSRLSAVGFFA
jgi:hypothetical protein